MERKIRSLGFAAASMVLSMSSLCFALPKAAHHWNFENIVERRVEDLVRGRPAPGIMGESANVVLDESGARHVLQIQPKRECDLAANVEMPAFVAQFGTNDFTVSHWYRTKFSAAGKIADILGNREAGTYGNYFSVRLSAAGSIVAELSEDEGGKNYVAVDSGQTKVNDQKWHHLVYLRSGPRLAIYIDAQLVGSGETSQGQTTSITTQTPFRIGRRYPACANLLSIDASFDDVQIFDRALQPRDIKEIYQHGRNGGR